MLEKNYNLDDPEEKNSFFDEIANKLLTFTEELERNFYMEAVAKEYMIDVNLLARRVNKLGYDTVIGSKQPVRGQKNVRRGKKKADNAIIKSQQLLLTWLIEKPELYDKIKDFIVAEDFTEGIYYVVAEIVFKLLEEEKAVVPAKIINYFQSVEEQTEAAALFSAETHGEMSQEAGESIIHTIYRIKKIVWINRV